MNEILDIQEAIANLNRSIFGANQSFEDWMFENNEWANPDWRIQKCFLQLLALAEAVGLNSTLSPLVLLAHREETRGAWVKFKKPVLSGMPVLDVRALKTDQTERLVYAYAALGTQTLLRFPETNDPVRQAIDAAVSAALGLPDLSILRKLLAQEPVVCLQVLS